MTEYVVPARLPVTTEEIVSHNQDNVKLRRWGPRQCELRQLVYFALNSSAEQSHKDSPRKSGSAARQPSRMRAKLHLPALDISWALQIVDSYTACPCPFTCWSMPQFPSLILSVFAGSCPCPFYLLVKAIFQPCFWVIPFQAPRV